MLGFMELSVPCGAKLFLLAIAVQTWTILLVSAEPTEQIVSRNKPCMQSSLHSGSTNCARAVDDDLSTTHPKCLHTALTGDAAPWMQIDLGERICLTRVELITRQDCCPDKLRNFKVFVKSDSSAAGTNETMCYHYPGSAKPDEVFKFNCTKCGRYLRILNGMGPLQLCDLKAYATIEPTEEIVSGKLVSLNKPCTQSSLYTGSTTCALAVDDDLSTTHPRCLHTAMTGDAAPWVQIDLGERMCLTRVELSTRQDCCPDKLRNFKVFVKTDSSAAGTNETMCYHYPGSATPNEVFKFNCTKCGRYLRVLNGMDPLQLCDLKAYVEIDTHTTAPSSTTIVTLTPAETTNAQKTTPPTASETTPIHTHTTDPSSTTIVTLTPAETTNAQKTTTQTASETTPSPPASSCECKNGGTCEQGGCRCLAGYSGSQCESDVDECYPNPCGKGVCVDGIASYSCTCVRGYTGKNCTEDVDECISSPCGLHICVNNPGSYTCKCNNGFRMINGACQEAAMIPFVPKSCLSPRDNTLSEWIKLDYFPAVGGEFVEKFKISPNGYILFKSTGKAHPRILTTGLASVKEPLISGFWYDLMILNENELCYSTENKVNSDAVSKIVSMVKNLTTNAEFIPKNTFAVTWSNAKLFNYYLKRCADEKAWATSVCNQTNFESITFQIVVTTSATETFLVINIGEQTVKKSRKTSVVGYTDGRSKVVEVSDAFREKSNGLLESSVGNSGVYGRWIYKISSSPDTSRSRCIASLRQRPSLSSLQYRACPFSMATALSDRRFSPHYTTCSGASGQSKFQMRTCLRSRIYCLTKGCVRGVRGKFWFALCCYQLALWKLNLRHFCDTSGRIFGTRIRGFFITNLADKPGTVRTFETGGHIRNATDDLLLDDCTSGGVDSTIKTMWNDKFPVSSFMHYRRRRMRRAWMWGDPHITTLDGHIYPFNGHCEYQFLRSRAGSSSADPLGIQFRAELAASSDPARPAQATVFTAFAFAAADGTPLSVALDQSTEQVAIHYNRSVVYASIDELLNGPSNPKALGSFSLLATDNSTLEISIGFGAATAVIKQVLSYLQASFQLDDMYTNNVEGLLGNFNGNASDDLSFENGTQLPIGANERDVFQMGQTWHIQSDQDSLFTYQSGGKTRSQYCNLSFIPVFLEDFKNQTKLLELFGGNADLLEKANETCANNVEAYYLSCMYDTAQMQTLDAATVAQETSNQIVSDEKIALNNPPQMYMPAYVILREGQALNISVLVNDSDGDPLTLSLVVKRNDVVVDLANDNTLRLINQTLVFNGSAVESLSSFQVLAADNKDAQTAWSPSIRLCRCPNGAECSFDAVNATTEGLIVIGSVATGDCACRGSWSGRRCEISPCAAVPEPCYDGATCSVQNDTISCPACPSGMIGDGQRCERVNPCLENADLCEDVCEQANVSRGYQCECSKSGFQVSSSNFSRCEDINECAGSHTCKLQQNQTCINTVGSHRCECPYGQRINVLSDCQDINECSEGLHNCTNQNASCVNHVITDGGGDGGGAVGFECVCLAGTSRAAPDDVCRSPPRPTTTPAPAPCGCVAGIACVDSVCQCPSYRTGSRCQNEVKLFHTQLTMSSVILEQTMNITSSVLGDNSTSQFQALAKVTCDYLHLALRSSASPLNNTFVGCRVTHYTESSVVSHSELRVRAALSPPTSSDALRAALVDGAARISANQSLLVPALDPPGAAIAVADVDECASGGSNDCHVNARCANTDGGFTCACAAGYVDPLSRAAAAERPGRFCEADSTSTSMPVYVIVLLSVFGTLGLVCAVIAFIILFLFCCSRRSRVELRGSENFGPYADVMSSEEYGILQRINKSVEGANVDGFVLPRAVSVVSSPVSTVRHFDDVSVKMPTFGLSPDRYGLDQLKE